jgi:hypothetical protein
MDLKLWQKKQDCRDLDMINYRVEWLAETFCKTHETVLANLLQNENIRVGAGLKRSNLLGFFFRFYRI